ncbi:MAG: MoaD/ThiS family protein [Candidatus Thermoplasmatota archaeon]|nr:MoaD/ThiS family protein [Candidatus Thermoplasmatota archaeon]
MKIKVRIPKTNNVREIQIKKGSTVADLLKNLNIKPDTVIAMSKNMPIPVDDTLNENQEITIIHVSSGG